VRYPV